MEKVWKSIKGYEGLYQVSNLGEVRGIGTDNFFKEVDSKLYSSGYLNFSLSKEDVERDVEAHKLVASTFLFRESLASVICHKNNIKTDNRVDNLKWEDDKKFISAFHTPTNHIFIEGKYTPNSKLTVEERNG